MKSAVRIMTASVVTLILATGTASARKKATPPDYLDERFSPRDVATLAVLPVADIRKDKSVQLRNLDNIAHRAVRRSLKKSSYDLVFQTESSEDSAITGDDLEYPTEPWIQELGTEDQRYVMLVVLDDAARKKTYGSAFGAVCSGYLFDKEAGLVWRHEATGTAGQGGLIGFVLNNSVRSGAFEVCTSQLMASFPSEKRSKKNKKK